MTYDLTLRVKPRVIQSFLTFDSVEGSLKLDHSNWKAGEQCFIVVFVCFSTSNIQEL